MCERERWKMMSQSAHVAAVIMPTCVLEKEGDTNARELVAMGESVYAVRHGETGAMLAACPLLEMQRWKARNTSWLFTTAKEKDDEVDTEEEGMIRVKEKEKKKGNVGDYLEQGEDDMQTMRAQWW